ncbi:unnamed protein product [Ectocarpus sp. CCAP 1310/34]|nr:unnamed protein product [Ectocarpus sp. CCAP 1310/34]
MCLVLELNIALLATVNAPVLSLLMDGLASTEAQRSKFGLHGFLCCESLCLGSVADQSPS